MGSAFLLYGIKVVLYGGCIVLGVLTGKKLRERKDRKAALAAK